jgi:hypothetical protein
MEPKYFKIVGVNVAIFIALLVLVEFIGQAIARRHPSFDVLHLQPDRVLGWKLAPNHRFPWAGSHWYAADFSVEIETNPLGFRDIEREFLKPTGVKRVALLGDSFIEAAQVPFEKTAAQILERGLNALSEDDPKISHWEVLNFGVSSFGLGQFLLTWEEYARHFNPDYVAILVAQLHMVRTVTGEKAGAFVETKNKRLSIRPTFRLDVDTLVREPARDYDQFIALQEDLIETEFSGKRVRRKKTGLITFHYAKMLRTKFWPQPAKIHETQDTNILAVNLKIIEELRRKADRVGSRLVVLDASQYFGDGENISIALRETCTKNEMGYIPVYYDLLKANMEGTSTRWARDAHFNEAGNEILANALFRWISQNSKASGT